MDVKPAPGVLLIAHPWLPDPNFRRAVILLCEHDEGEGSFGLVLNRKIPRLMRELLVDFDAFETSLFQGGPVQTDTLHVLHQHADMIEDAISVTPDIGWGGDVNMIRLMVETEHVPIETFRFFIGYAGWGVGQLQDEIDEGTWILHPSDGKHVFETDPAELWRSVLREMGGEYAILANYPDDPRMN